MKYDSLIFDLDGTLWDTCETCAFAWNTVLDLHSISFRRITANDIRNVTGKPHEECIRTVFNGLPEETLNQLIARTMMEDNRMVKEKGGIIYHGVPEGIKALANNIKLFIVSNCQSGYIENFLEFSRLTPYFADTECWGNSRLSKAKNAEAIITRNNLKSPLIIGDTASDYAAAKAVGVPFVFVNYGFGVDEGYEYCFDSFPELTKWLLGL